MSIFCLFVFGEAGTCRGLGERSFIIWFTPMAGTVLGWNYDLGIQTSWVLQTQAWQLLRLPGRVCVNRKLKSGVESGPGSVMWGVGMKTTRRTAALPKCQFWGGNFDIPRRGGGSRSCLVSHLGRDGFCWLQPWAELLKLQIIRILQTKERERLQSVLFARVLCRKQLNTQKSYEIKKFHTVRQKFTFNCSILAQHLLDIPPSTLPTVYMSSLSFPYGRRNFPFLENDYIFRGEISSLFINRTWYESYLFIYCFSRFKEEFRQLTKKRK